MAQAGLQPDENLDCTCLVWEEDTLVATGSRKDNILKCLAVDQNHQGQDLTATVITQLRQDAFAQGHRRLFLYTKPKNKWMFTSLLFYPVAQTGDVLLMESESNGIGKFLDALPKSRTQGKIGAAVMNCNPFTRGHQYLVEKAAEACDHLYIFVLSEDKSAFLYTDRMAMVECGTAHLDNVTVLPTGPYLISSATFPTYFLKDREKATAVQCQLDMEIFLCHFVPRFGITHRFVGTEPLSPMTHLYNEALKATLPGRGVRVCEIPRLEGEGGPISATRLRQALETGDQETARSLIPDTTFQYLKILGYFPQGISDESPSAPGGSFDPSSKRSKS